MENKYITASNLIDLLSNQLDDYIQEAYWMESFNEDILYSICMDYVGEHDIIITDHDDFDWSGKLLNLYNCTEKGLS